MKTPKTRKQSMYIPAVVLSKNVLDSLCQSEGFAGTIGPNEENWRQVDRNWCGDGQNGFLLLGIQTGIQLLIPLPGCTVNEALLRV